MSEQENMQTVQRTFEAFGRGDVPAFIETLSEDVEWTIAGASNVPYAGTRHGHEGAVEFLQVLGGSVEFEAFEPREFVAQGDKVAVIGFERGRVRATNKTFDNPWVLVFTLAAGKIKKFQSYEDTHAVSEAFAG